MAAAKQTAPAWQRRLYIPCYKAGEAARYARTPVQTVGRWHSRVNRPVLSDREPRSDLNYLQLIEFSVVAAMRDAGIKLAEVAATREFFQKQHQVEYPFAELRFKTDGKELICDLDQIIGDGGRDKLIHPGKSGQLSWNEIIGRRLKEFEFDDGGLVTKWYVNGLRSSIVLDPRVSFGAPHVNGAAVWAIADRYRAGESVPDIANDLDVTEAGVIEALKFEGIAPDLRRKNLCLN